VNGLSLLAGELLVYRVLMVWVYDHTGSVSVAMLRPMRQLPRKACSAS